VEQREVLQGVRSDAGLAALHLLVLPDRHQLGGDLGVEHRAQDVAHLVGNRPVSATQRMRCWICVLGTPPLTL
jgi:hypothetical protein